MSPRSSATERKKLLRIYLNDHLAGATLAVRVTRRALGSNRGGPLGAFLQDFLTEISEDRDALGKIMGDLGLPTDRLKQAAAAAGERVGRLKLNGSLTGYSDLSRLVELEGLHAGVNAKLGLWKSLQHVADVYEPIDPAALEGLIGRAESQLERLEHHRLAAAERALGRSGA
jgi:hypothetical protein